MVEFEADDAIASAAVRFQDDPAVDQVVICWPDKDLAQLVSGDRIVCWDRRRDIVYDEDAVIGKYCQLRQPQFQTGWHWWENPPTVFPECLLGGPSLLLLRAVQVRPHRGHPGRYNEVGYLRQSCPPASGKSGGAQRAGALVPPSDHSAQDVPLQTSLDDLKWRGAREDLRRLCLALGANDLPEYYIL